MTATREPKVDGRTARRADTKEAILYAAAELFVTKGMSTTSVDDIAEAAQVAKGSIYYNFGSKANLVEALMTEALERTRSSIAEAASGLRGVPKRRAILETLLRRMQAHPYATRLMVNEVFRTDREWHDTAAQWHQATTDLLTDDLVAETRRPVDDCAIIAGSMVGACLVAAMEWLTFRPDRTVEQVRDAVFAALALD